MTSAVTCQPASLFREDQEEELLGRPGKGEASVSREGQAANVQDRAAWGRAGRRGREEQGQKVLGGHGLGSPRVREA